MLNLGGRGGGEVSAALRSSRRQASNLRSRLPVPEREPWLLVGVRLPATSPFCLCFSDQIGGIEVVSGGWQAWSRERFVRPLDAHPRPAQYVMRDISLQLPTFLALSHSCATVLRSSARPCTDSFRRHRYGTWQSGSIKARRTAAAALHLVGSYQRRRGTTFRDFHITIPGSSSGRLWRS